MEIREFSIMNRRRCESPVGFCHEINNWSLSDWMTATCGELGEAANIIKKQNRIRDRIHGNRREETLAFLEAQLRKEICDAYTYLDLLAQAAGFDLQDAVLDRFAEVSRRINYQI